MTQQTNTLNWVLQDANGQVIKVVNPPKNFGNLVTTNINGHQFKVLKTAGSTPEKGQSVLASGQVIRTIGMQNKGTPTRMVTAPLSMNVLTTQKNADGSLVQKTIRLPASQMSGLKVINTATQQQQQQQPKIKQEPGLSPVSTPTPHKTHISSILDHSGARKRQDIMDYTPEYKRRKTEKVGKGLRHFSMKVCEKVRKKGTTSYNEVADELVGEFTNPALNNSPADQQYDQKNIRRRVYDALNVLMAMNIISKEKKEIRWLGLPTNSLQECVQLENEKRKKIERIRQKTQQLYNLVMQQVSFKNLVERNKERCMTQGPPPPNSTIQLPFIIVNTNKKTVIDCSISNDKLEYMFEFNDKFEIHDDFEVLKKIGMLMGLDQGECTPEQLEKIKSLVPLRLQDYVTHLCNGSSDPLQEMLAMAGQSSSSMCGAEEFVEASLGEDLSHQSYASDMSPSNFNDNDFSDDEQEESDMSSDVEINN